MAYGVGQGVEEEKVPIRYKTIFNSSTNDISYLKDSDNKCLRYTAFSSLF